MPTRSQTLQYKVVFLGFDIGITLRAVSSSGLEWILVSSRVPDKLSQKLLRSRGCP